MTEPSDRPQNEHLSTGAPPPAASAGPAPPTHDASPLQADPSGHVDGGRPVADADAGATAAGPPSEGPEDRGQAAAAAQTDGAPGHGDEPPGDGPGAPREGGGGRSRRPRRPKGGGSRDGDGAGRPDDRGRPDEAGGARSGRDGGSKPGSGGGPRKRRSRGDDRREGYDGEPRRAGQIRKVIEHDHAADLEALAEKTGAAWGAKPPWIKNRFATYQVREVVGIVERLKRADFAGDAAVRREFLMLRPKIAYLARRHHDDDLYEFARVVRFGVEIVGDNVARFRRFCDFFDAMLAYFRAAGGR